MGRFSTPARSRVRAFLCSLALLLGWGVLAGDAPAQEAEEPSGPGPALEILQVGCDTCGSGLAGGLRAPDLPPYGGGGDFVLPRPTLGPQPPVGDPGCVDCGEGCCTNCVPGRRPCDPNVATSVLGRFVGGIYNCICCPDPCYEGKWYPLADAAFFTEAVRPVIQQRFRWDSGRDVILLDRSEFFWPRADGRGKGPRPVAPLRAERKLRYDDLVMITEGGTGAISVIAETSYRTQQGDVTGHAAGFTDLRIATKTLLFDCELLQISFMMKTYTPTGTFTKGLGVGHVSLEPSLLVGLKLSPTTYLQTQLSEWIPLGGDAAYQGSVLHYHLSLNQELCRILPEMPVIGTAEFVGYSFQDGLYTDPYLGTLKSSGYTYAYGGLGVRLFVCDKIDIGFGWTHAISQQHFARDLYRTEFRLRF